MHPYKVLLIEDELAMALIIKDSLESRGFTVIHSPEGNAAYELYISHKPDILILDVMLPSESGLNIAAKIRIEDTRTPILFLTARTMPSDVFNGFKVGGNGYLKKPFDMEELIIRLKVLLNQDRLLTVENSTIDISIVDIGEFSFNIRQNTLMHRGIVKKLTARESEALKILYQYRSQLLTRKAFLMQIWGDDDFFSSRSLDVYISKLRKYLKADPNIQIINHRGFGYKLIC
ncbi:MAG: response regulator transcription factor [Mucilaginibacter sp.]|uniref:response regulator transcription factor n=1 Tax=Mucilaginibacter sp. TaxID=1882438 RepID=UPI0032657099